MRRARYKSGDRIGQLELIECIGRNGRNAIWRVRCDCGEEFSRRDNAFTITRSMCSDCSRASRQRVDTLARHYSHMPPKDRVGPPCRLCHGMAHRVLGPRCRNLDCKLLYADEPALRAEARWQSSAGFMDGTQGHGEI